LLPDDEASRRVKAGGFRRGTSRSPASLAALRQQLAASREQGYAVEDQEEVEGVRCLAAPVIGADGSGVAAIGCIGLTNLLSEDQLPTIASAVQRAAARVSAELASHGMVTAP
jgi:IclR family acetate operon transcriptional repressor